MSWALVLFFAFNGPMRSDMIVGPTVSESLTYSSRERCEQVGRLWESQHDGAEFACLPTR